jgi:hypothetical protein
MHKPDASTNTSANACTSAYTACASTANTNPRNTMCQDQTGLVLHSVCHLQRTLPTRFNCVVIDDIPANATLSSERAMWKVLSFDSCCWCDLQETTANLHDLQRW